MKETIKSNLYDREEIIYPCTVQILTNTITGEVSVGWWRGTPNDIPDGKGDAE